MLQNKASKHFCERKKKYLYVKEIKLQCNGDIN